MKYTLEMLNELRAKNCFGPVEYPISQRMINQQCREWIASYEPVKIKGTADLSGCDHDDYKRHYGG